LFTGWMHLEERLIKDSEILPRNVFRWLEDDQKPMSIGNSSALLLEWESAKNRNENASLGFQAPQTGDNRLLSLQTSIFEVIPQTDPKVSSASIMRIAPSTSL
jgi:hypothetical protein